MDEHLSTLQALASGIDPVSGEVLSPRSVYNHPQVIRALHFALEHVKQRVSSRPRSGLTLKEKQQDNVNRGLPENAGLPWTTEARDSAAEQFKNNQSIGEIAKAMGRTHSAIRSELIRQGLIALR